MSIESYLLINKSSNIVENIVDWDGGNSWTPPDNYIAMQKSTTPAKIWLPNPTTRVFDLVEIIGAGDIGFTWDGTVLMTNIPQPDSLPPITTNE